MSGKNINGFEKARKPSISACLIGIPLGALLVFVITYLYLSFFSGGFEQVLLFIPEKLNLLNTFNSEEVIAVTDWKPGGAQVYIPEPGDYFFYSNMIFREKLGFWLEGEDGKVIEVITTNQNSKPYPNETLPGIAVAYFTISEAGEYYITTFILSENTEGLLLFIVPDVISHNTRVYYVSCFTHIFFIGVLVGLIFFTRYRKQKRESEPQKRESLKKYDEWMEGIRKKENS